MRIVSWNVNGIRAIIKKDFQKNLKELEFDIVCLQETKAQEDEVAKALSIFPELHLYSNSAEKKGYSGTAVLSKHKPQSVSYGMDNEEHDSEGRILCLEFESFYLVNVYVPNSGQKLVRLSYRKKWDADFLEYLKEKQASKPVIVCGDLNVAHRAIDLKNDKSNYNKTAGYTQTEIDGMDNFLKSGFVDTFRAIYPDRIQYSYWSYRFKARERNTGWRIDYFLVSNSLMERVNDSDILPDYYGSDHCPVVLDLK